MTDEQIPRIGDGWQSATDAYDAGMALREVVDHVEQAGFTVAKRRPSVLDFLRATEQDRAPELLPMRHQRMSVDPFAFFRGTAGMMAFDLAQSPSTGLHAQICGDAHAANFGLYGTHDGRIVMDINDFDETVIGPWEWDLKRLCTSLVLAARVAGHGEDIGRKAARHASRAYRRTAQHLAQLDFLESWTALGDDSALAHSDADDLEADLQRATDKAARNTSERVASKITHRDIDDDWHFVPDPPVLQLIDQVTEDALVQGLHDYVPSLRGPRRALVSRFRIKDVALRVVGTGSVGLRSYVALLQGNRQEALILQLKQAVDSALSPYVADVPGQHDGDNAHRILRGARLVQVETDPLFGWTCIGGRSYIVRQFRNRKGSVDPTEISARTLDDYGRLAGSLLGRAHCRSVDPRVLAAYLGKGKPFDHALTEFSVSYADQVETDHSVMRDLITDGVVESS